jgi:transcriptional regulator with XRE-family HTH domain
MSDTYRSLSLPILNDRRRFDAAIAYRGMSLRSFAALLGRWTPQHIAHVVAGERKGSDELYAAIRARLGEPLWRFATGQTDTLRDTEPTRCHPSTK